MPRRPRIHLDSVPVVDDYSSSLDEKKSQAYLEAVYLGDLTNAARKQGARRLIRDISDCGVLVVCDPRLLRCGYGQVFLDSMPPMARTRDIADVERFFSDTA